MQFLEKKLLHLGSDYYHLVSSNPLIMLLG